MHVQFQLLFEQFYVLRFFHSGVRRTSSTTAHHGTLNNFARQVFHCGYNIFLVKILTQWPPNVHVARCKLQHCALHVLPLCESPMAMTSGKVQFLSYPPVGLQSKFFAETYRNSAGTYCCTFYCFKRNTAWIVLQDLFGKRHRAIFPEHSHLWTTRFVSCHETCYQH